jgi:hypothetical protein
MTVQRTIHLLYPETRPWGFVLSDENDSDRKIFQYFMWSLSPLDENMSPARLAEIGRKSVVVAFQPPWILSEQDIREFSQCRSVRISTYLSIPSHISPQFPPFRVPGNAFPTPLESKERLWAKVSILQRHYAYVQSAIRYGMLALRETHPGLS